MTFALPGLLAGAALAAVPILLHLLFRPRPRELRFPAVMLLEPALRAGRRSQRLRHFWLLLARALVIACVAILLAQPTCRAQSADSFARVPVATVVVVDDSWSTRYQTAGGDESRERATRAIRNELDQLQRRPVGSRTGLTFAAPERPAEPLAADAAVLLPRLRDSVDAVHAAPLGIALDEAGTMLRAAQQPLRRVVVVTDNQRSAWRNVPPTALAGIDQLRLEVVIPTPPVRSNLFLAHVQTPRATHAAGTPLVLAVEPRVWGAPAEARVAVWDATGETLLRRSPSDLLDPGEAPVVEIVLPSFPPGAHGFTVRLEPDDRLTADQTRWFAITAVEKPTATLIAPADDENLTTVIVRNLLTPDGLPADAQFVELTQQAPGSVRFDDRTDLVILLSGLTLAPNARDALEKFVRGGGTLLLIPRATERVEFPGVSNWVLRDPLRTESTPTGTQLQWPAPIRGSDVSARNAAATRVRIVAEGMYDDATTTHEFSDETPAVITRPLARGTVHLLMTSPDPAWSDLGRRAAGLLTWLHERARFAARGQARSANYTVGQTVGELFPRLPTNGTVTVRRVGRDDADATRIAIDEGALARGWPTDKPGLYEITDTNTAERRALYAVNWPQAESDLSVATEPELRASLGVEDVSVIAPSADDDAPRPEGWAAALGMLEPRSVLLGALLGLLVLELALSGTRRAAASGASA